MIKKVTRQNVIMPVRGKKFIEIPGSQCELVWDVGPKIYRLCADVESEESFFNEGSYMVPNWHQEIYANCDNLFLAKASCEHAMRTYRGDGFFKAGDAGLLVQITAAYGELSKGVLRWNELSQEGRERFKNRLAVRIVDYARALDERKVKMRGLASDIYSDLCGGATEVRELRQKFEELIATGRALDEHFEAIVKALDGRHLTLTRLSDMYTRKILDRHQRVIEFSATAVDFAACHPTADARDRLSADLREWSETLRKVKDRPYLNGARHCAEDLDGAQSALMRENYRDAYRYLEKVRVWLELALLFRVYSEMTTELSFMSEDKDLDQVSTVAFAGRIRRLAERLGVSRLEDGTFSGGIDSAFRNPVTPVWFQHCHEAAEILDPKQNFAFAYDAPKRAAHAKERLRAFNPKF